MDLMHLLVFDLDGTRFAVDASCVRESLWLPELTVPEEAPPWVVGILDLRGLILPVVDLHLRLNHPARRYGIDDRIVVVEAAHRPIGLIVSDVIEVVELANDAIQAPSLFAGASPAPAHLVAGEVRVGTDLVTLLDVSRLADFSAQAAGKTERSEAISHFCPQAGPDERAVFRSRARLLMEAADEEGGELIGLAVMELGGEFFAVELDSVQEFCTIAKVNPIPCCPPHILGAMNLRGNLVTLIDPRAALNLSTGAKGGKAVVSRLGEQAVGIAVDELHGAVYLPQKQLQAPLALREQFGAEIMGVAQYAGRVMTVLNLPALLAREQWIVNENV